MEQRGSQVSRLIPSLPVRCHSKIPKVAPSRGKYTSLHRNSPPPIGINHRRRRNSNQFVKLPAVPVEAARKLGGLRYARAAKQAPVAQLSEVESFWCLDGSRYEGNGRSRANLQKSAQGVRLSISI